MFSFPASSSRVCCISCARIVSGCHRNVVDEDIQVMRNIAVTIVLMLVSDAGSYVNGAVLRVVGLVGSLGTLLGSVLASFLVADEDAGEAASEMLGAAANVSGSNGTTYT